MGNKKDMVVLPPHGVQKQSS